MENQRYNLSKQHFRRELEKEAARKKDYDGKRLENIGHVRKITKTQILGDGTYRILADLHYCRQTVKRDDNENIITKNTKKMLIVNAVSATYLRPTFGKNPTNSTPLFRLLIFLLLVQYIKAGKFPGVSS